MLTFQELKKNCKKTTAGMPSVRFGILGDCATQLLAKAIYGYAYERHLAFQIFDADYNQILLLAADPTSELYQFDPEYLLVCMCSEKLYESFCSCPSDQRAGFAEQTVKTIQGIWEMVAVHSKARILQTNFVLLDDSVFGGFSNKAESSFLFQLRKLNLLLMERAQQNKHVFLVDLCSLQARLGRGTFFDVKFYYSAKMPFSMDALPHISKLVVDIINALRGKIMKCVVLDLDNTLWGGVIGDDGLSGIQIGELGAGHAFSDLQMWLKELKRRGILLAVCSKNNEEAAKEPFEKHPEMILRLEDIAIFVANWEDKVTNIRIIQQTLNIGMDSMLFLDDNPFERHMVSSMIPEITVPELPEDPAQYLSFLQAQNYFETASFSNEDAGRTRQYQAEIGRLELQRQYESIDGYLISLEMRAEVKPFDSFYYPRISQLTQRSNQFNLRTIRYTEGEIEELTNHPEYITRYFTLKDKFGDHGLISVVILHKQENTLFITNWLMSCRVLKRGMEEFIINSILSLAEESGFAKVVGEYIRTPKNAMVEHIYEKMGFQRTAGNCYEVDVKGYQPHTTYIQGCAE